MKARYRLIRRGIRGGAFYSVDTKNGRRTSLGTANPDEAAQIIEAKNIAERQPVLNLQIAKAYLAGTDSGLTTRTWQQAMETLMEGKQGANRERWSRVATDRALAPLLPRTIVDTPGELMLKVLQSGTVFNQCFSAPVAQLLFGHELAGVAAGAQTPMACRSLQGQAGYYMGGTLQDHRAREEPGTQSLLPVGLACRGVAIGLGAPASRGRGLAGAHYLFLSDEDALARIATAADSIWQGG